MLCIIDQRQCTGLLHARLLLSAFVAVGQVLLGHRRQLPASFLPCAAPFRISWGHAGCCCHDSRGCTYGVLELFSTRSLQELHLRSCLKTFQTHSQCRRTQIVLPKKHSSTRWNCTCHASALPAATAYISVAVIVDSGIRAHAIRFAGHGRGQRLCNSFHPWGEIQTIMRRHFLVHDNSYNGPLLCWERLNNYEQRNSAACGCSQQQQRVNA